MASTSIRRSVPVFHPVSQSGIIRFTSCHRNGWGWRIRTSSNRVESALLPVTTIPLNGRSDRNRTDDSSRVKGVLCRLSYRPKKNEMMVGLKGVAPSRYINSHSHLKATCLLIPPQAQKIKYGASVSKGYEPLTT